MKWCPCSIGIMANDEMYGDKAPQASAAHSVSTWRTIALIELLVIVALLAFVIGRGFGGVQAADEAAPQSGTQAAQQEAQPQQQAPQMDTHAPTITDETGLKILRAEPKRDPNDPRAVGKADAPVVMVEFTDYSCPMCTKFAHETEAGLQELVDNGTLRIEYRDLVIFQQYGSDIAAAGGWAAAEQGKHSEYRKAVWDAAQGHPTYTVESVVELAKAAGVPDLDKFRATLESPETKAKVQAESEHAGEVGIRGTPFMMINDSVVSGAYPLDYVLRTIEEQAKLVQK